MVKLTVSDFIAKGFDERMAKHLVRSQRAQPKPVTPDRILFLANLKGHFDASLRYRDDKLRAMCARLKRNGHLSGGKRQGKTLVYEITDLGRQALTESKSNG